MQRQSAMRTLVVVAVYLVLINTITDVALANYMSAVDERSSAAAARQQQLIPAIFNFGDSNSDTGGLGAAFGPAPPPHGITTFHRPSGRYCDGRLLIDFIAEELGMPYLDAYLQSVGSNFQRGANFATAGSTIRRQNTTLAQSGFSPFSLGVQVTQFAEFKQRTLTFHSQEPFSSLLPHPHYFDDALYVVDIGQNDLTAGYFLNLTLHQVKAFIPQVLQEFEGHIKALHGQGAKKFLITTTGPVGCLPYILVRLPYTKTEVDEYGCAEPYNKMARAFNRELSATIHKLQRQLPKTKFVMADGYNLKYNLFVNAHKDGFRSTVKACCGYGGGLYNFNPSLGYCGSKPREESMLKKHLSYNLCQYPSAYINWDGVHYTEAANHAMAQRLFSGNFTTPKFSVGNFCGLFA
ncbi:hypothetical protein GOP47_0015270 [Adiantum capillus-veneris]|uniref:GDSL esterase/lipase n=1 Tax=Adiantum capillus-veneris TaxID=13818 RepID=A0A9D4UK41_ADICA|nr:hypothetical protein GOP47_0015270 [Adiantum capillus-veneris]